MATPRKSDSTREQILEQGYTLFNNLGYNGTGLKEILHASGIPKGSFYHYFESKEHFAVEIINHYRALQFDRWETEFKQPGLDKLSQIRRALGIIIEEYGAQQPMTGCLLANLSGELANSSPYFREAIQRSSQEVLNCIRDDMRIAQEEGTVRRDIPADELASVFFSSWQGAILRMKVTQSTEPLRLAVSHLLDRYFRPPVTAN